MPRVLISIRESLNSFGWVNGSLYVVARALDKATRGGCRIFKYYFVAQPVPLRPETAFSLRTKTRIFQVSAGDGIIRHFPRPAEIVAKRFADGALCFVAERADELVGFIWIKQEKYSEDEVRCLYLLDPATQLVWDFDAYVAPQFRMSRAFAQLWEAVNRFLSDNGYRWTVSRISAFNKHSIASHRRLGAVHLHTGLFVTAGAFQLSLFSCAPYIHIAVNRTGCPEISFRPPAEPSRT
jgi:hypothetical protein